MYSTFLLSLIMLVTNLSGPYATEFNLILSEDKVLTTYHIKKSGNDQWALDWPLKENKEKTRTIYYHIDQSNVMRIEGFGGNDVDLNRYFDTGNIDWKTANEILPSESQKTNDKATPIMLKRDGNGFQLTQEKGLVSVYTNVRVNWLTLN